MLRALGLVLVALTAGGNRRGSFLLVIILRGFTLRFVGADILLYYKKLRGRRTSRLYTMRLAARKVL